MIFLIVVVNGHILLNVIGAYVQNHDFCFPLIYTHLKSSSSISVRLSGNMDELMTQDIINTKHVRPLIGEGGTESTYWLGSQRTEVHNSIL